jgi:SAM-dependent methyltransferase
MRTLPVILCLALAPYMGFAQDSKKKNFGTECRVVYVPTGKDLVYDLGCGDGRVLLTAAKKYGAKGVGIDIDPARVRECNDILAKAGMLKEMVEIREQDALKVKDLERATVIDLYMLPEFMEKIEKQLDRLKPGTRIVAHDYPLSQLRADQVVEFQGPDRSHTLYLWTVKESKKDVDVPKPNFSPWKRRFPS